MDDVLKNRRCGKSIIRLLPFAILSYFLAYIDRINGSFAALTMRGDLGMSATAYGFAVGTFYWGYFIFEVPSNVVLEKVGARIWIARIMITWGILAGATAAVTGANQFRRGPLPARQRRGGLLPGHRAVLHLLVSELPSRPHRLRFSDRAADRSRRRCAGFHRASGPRWHVGTEGLADHVYRRGRAHRADRHRHAVRADRSSGAGEVPDGGGKGLAEREAGLGTQRQGSGAEIQHVAGHVRPEGAAAGA